MLQRRTLAFLGLILALGGQYLLDSQPEWGIIVLGGCLIVTLLERWIYLVPLSQNWVGPLLLGLLGLGYWREPRGWFFIAWAAVIAGTGLRADRFIKGYVDRLRAEEERRERLSQMGFTGPPDESEEVGGADDGAADPTPDGAQGADSSAEALLRAAFPPLTFGRVAMALLLGSLAALVSALAAYLLFLLVHLQLDLIAIFGGWLVGRAILQGTGGRSHRGLQVAGALLTVLGVALGRYLILRHALFQGAEALPESTKFLVTLYASLTRPGEVLGIWFLLFIVVGAWCGFQYSRGYQGR